MHYCYHYYKVTNSLQVPTSAKIQATLFLSIHLACKQNWSSLSENNRLFSCTRMCWDNFCFSEKCVSLPKQSRLSVCLSVCYCFACLAFIVVSFFAPLKTFRWLEMKPRNLWKFVSFLNLPWAENLSTKPPAFFQLIDLSDTTNLPKMLIWKKILELKVYRRWFWLYISNCDKRKHISSYRINIGS